jgi:hypothetical protein
MRLVVEHNPPMPVPAAADHRHARLPPVTLRSRQIRVRVPVARTTLHANLGRLRKGAAFSYSARFSSLVMAPAARNLYFQFLFHRGNILLYGLDAFAEVTLGIRVILVARFHRVTIEISLFPDGDNVLAFAVTTRSRSSSRLSRSSGILSLPSY